jgi:hypothetical protein
MTFAVLGKHPGVIAGAGLDLGCCLIAAELLVKGADAFAAIPGVAAIARWVAAAGAFRGYEYLSRDYGLWWSDGHYNLLRAYYLLHGFTLYSDIPSAQFPGLHVLYAGTLGLLGYATARPGPELVPQIERAGQFITGVFQLLLLVAAGHAARLRRGATLLVAFGTVYFFWERYGHFIPIVETVLLPGTALLTVLLFRTVLDADSLDRRATGLALLLLLLPLGALGVTLAPTFILWGVGTCGVLTLDWWRRRHDQGAVGLTDDRRVLLGSLAVGIGLFYGLIWFSIDLKKMMYWAVRQPRAAFGIDVLANLRRVLTSWPERAFRFGDPTIFAFGANGSSPARDFPLLGTLPSVMCVLGLVLLSCSDRSIARRLAFGALILVGALLCRWRWVDEFHLKSVPVVGIPLGLCFVLLAPACRAVGTPGLPEWRAWLPTAAGALLTLPIGLAVAAKAFGPPRSVSPRPTALDVSRVCRLNEPVSGCRCTLQATYDPRLFLALDVQPCVGLSPDHPHAVQRERKSREQFAAATRNTSVAFIVGPEAKTSTDVEVTQRQYDTIVELRTCRPLAEYPLTEIYQVCAAP